MAMLEAGLCGVCLVCTDVGGCSELMGNGSQNYGRLTSARNPAMIAYGQLEVMAMLPSLRNRKLQVRSTIFSCRRWLSWKGFPVTDFSNLLLLTLLIVPGAPSH